MQKNIECYQLTSVGDRVANQDCMAYKIYDNYALFIVADGLGGHHAGEKASKYFCQGMFRQASKFHQLLKNKPNQANKIVNEWVAAAIVDMAKSFSGDAEAADSHTTCVILYLNEVMSLTAHCGDSRVYRMNSHKVLWRTKDHSLIQRQLDAGEITEREMGLHPEQNQLTRSINIKSRHSVDIKVYSPIKKGETFLLCTDGFWEFIKEKDLLQLAAPESNIADLRKIAKMMHFRAQGKGDNLTVQWVRFI